MSYQQSHENSYFFCEKYNILVERQHGFRKIDKMNHFGGLEPYSENTSFFKDKQYAAGVLLDTN